MALSLSKQEQQAVSFAKGNLKQRIQRLKTSRRITPDIAASLARKVDTVRLSFDETGEIAGNAVLNAVEAYEALPKNNAWSKSAPKDVQLSQERKPAWNPDGDSTDDETMAAWDATA
jgi:hypothetical protein